MIVQLIIVEEIENHHLKHFQKNTFIKVSRMLNTLPHLYLNCQSFLGQKKKKKIYIYIYIYIQTGNGSNIDYKLLSDF